MRRTDTPRSGPSRTFSDDAHGSRCTVSQKGRSLELGKPAALTSLGTVSTSELAPSASAPLYM
eukprot:672492-Prymnesium_polylepis.2